MHRIILAWGLIFFAGFVSSPARDSDPTVAETFVESRVAESLAIPSPFDPLLAIHAFLGSSELDCPVEFPDFQALHLKDAIGRAIAFGILYANVQSSIAMRSPESFQQIATAAEAIFDWRPRVSTDQEAIDWAILFADFAFWSELFLRDENFRTVAAVAAWLETLRHVTHCLKIHKPPGASNYLRAPAWVSSALGALDLLPVGWQSDGRIQAMKKALEEAKPLVSCKIKDYLPQENLLTLQTLAEATVNQLCASSEINSDAIPASRIFSESPALLIARKLANKYRAKGYAIGPTGDQGLLAPGQSRSFQVPVSRGLDYVFLVATSRQEADFDISVKDDERGLIRDDRRPDRFAGVLFRPGYSGTATVIVSLGSRESQGEWIFLAGRRPAPFSVWP